MRFADDLTDPDHRFLDEAFERAVERVEDGLSVSTSDLLDGREHLRDRVEELVRLARQVAVGPVPALPKLNDYTILSEIGSGGMGTVYLARQERLAGRPVALKVLPPSAALSSRARERFAAEAHAIARLQHPNIVAVHDVVQTGGVYAYAMEWVDGKSLSQLIDFCNGRAGGGHRVPVDDIATFLGAPQDNLPAATWPIFACRVAIAIARALAQVHEAGFLHRDVKPSNILIRRDGTPLLSDFGLAREADTTAYTQTGHFVGTPAYAAPEQLRAESGVLDDRTDVYALGVTLYHALTQRIPFGGRHAADILRRIEAGLADPIRKINPAFPRDLQTIVAAAMDPDPSRRYASADALADDLERLLNLQPIHARPVGWIMRTVKLARRNRRILAGALAGGGSALLLAMLLGVYLMWVPSWVKRHVDGARLELLNPRYAELVHSQTNKVSEPESWRSSAEGVAQRYDRALDDYDDALLGLTGRSAYLPLRLERDTVGLCISVLTGNALPPTNTSYLSRHTPTALRIARQWLANGGPDTVADAELNDVGVLDLRSVGLLAYLCFDSSLCERAWVRAGLDLAPVPDPLVDAALGQTHLVLRHYSIDG